MSEKPTTAGFLRGQEPAKKRTDSFPERVTTPTANAGRLLSEVLPRTPTLQKETWMAFHFETTDFSQVEQTIREGCQNANIEKMKILRALDMLDEKGKKKKDGFDFKKWEEAGAGAEYLFFYLEQMGSSPGKGEPNLEPAGLSSFRQAMLEYLLMRERETEKDSGPYMFFVTYGSECILPVSLRQHVRIISYTPLTKDDIRYLRDRAFQQLQNSIVWASGKGSEMDKPEWSDGDLEKLANYMAGMSELEARRLLYEIMRQYEKSICKHDGKSTSIMELAEKAILEFKNNHLDQSGTMTAQLVTSGIQNKGQEKIQEWFDQHKKFVREPAKAPKGIALVGLPGTGKSATAKMAASVLGLPLVKFEMSRILGGRVGDSEKGMDRFLNDLRFAAPCVLWIDEVEKAMGGVSNGGGSGDSNGVMDRLFGSLLTFMQENDRPVFTVVTANNIQKIPSEFFRSGRFDQVFCLMLPSYQGCIAIMAAKLEQYSGTNSIGTAQKLMQCCVGTEEHPRFLTGSDIDARVKELSIRFPDAPNEKNMKTISDSMRVLAEGDSYTTMRQCAQSYLRMIQDGMQMAGKGDTLYTSDNLDIDSARFYKCDPNNPQPPTCFRRKPPAGNAGGTPDNWYDRVLFEKLQAHICDEIIMNANLTPQETRAEYVKWKQHQRKSASS